MDFKIHCGEKTFDCNKVTVAARSNVFKTMFEHDIMESKQGEVLVKDVTPKVMEQVLKFIYTDKVDNTVPELMAMELFAAGNKYEFDGLKKLCETSIGPSIDEDNAIELLGFAKLYSLEDLKIKIIDFFKNVMGSEVSVIGS